MNSRQISRERCEASAANPARGLQYIKEADRAVQRNRAGESLFFPAGIAKL
ncbi:MAG: hypothetical protein ACK56J_01255 [Planctomycetota bacterium]